MTLLHIFILWSKLNVEHEKSNGKTDGIGGKMEIIRNSKTSTS